MVILLILSLPIAKNKLFINHVVPTPYMDHIIDYLLEDYYILLLIEIYKKKYGDGGATH